ncbi:MAG: DUF1573 domain-containing protein [Chloroflexota bacterium]
MKSILIGAFAAVTLAFCNTHAQPKLEIIGGETYNWGEVTPKQDPLKADIILKNAGTEKLQIQNVHPTCGCTTAPLDKSELAPGESTTMHVSLNVNGASDIHKSIRITSNDPVAKEKVLMLQAKVIRELQFTPTTYFAIPEMNIGAPSISKVTLENNSPQDVKLSNFKVTPENARLNLTKDYKLKAGAKVDLILTVDPTKSGGYNCSVTFNTSHPDYPEMRIMGFGHVKESIIYNNPK